MLSRLKALFTRRKRIQSISEIDLSLLGNVTLHTPGISDYETFYGPPPFRPPTFYEKCLSHWWCFAIFSVILSAQTIHHIYALAHPDSLTFHTFYRYLSASDIPRFGGFIVLNIAIILLCMLCGHVILHGTVRQGTRLGPGGILGWGIMGIILKTLPISVFIATFFISQPVPVMRVMMAKDCGETALTVEKTVSAIGVKNMWVTGKQGTEVTLRGWQTRWPADGTYKVALESKISSRKITENKWTKEVESILDTTVQFDPLSPDLMDDDPVVANYFVNVTLFPTPSPSPPSRDRLITWHQTGTIEDRRSLLQHSHKHQQSFPLLSPPLVAQVNKKGKRNSYAEMVESRLKALIWKVENETKYEKWCIGWPVEEILRNPEKMGTVAVVAGWIVGEDKVWRARKRSEWGFYNLN